MEKFTGYFIESKVAVHVKPGDRILVVDDFVVGVITANNADVVLYTKSEEIAEQSVSSRAPLVDITKKKRIVKQPTHKEIQERRELVTNALLESDRPLTAEQIAKRIRRREYDERKVRATLTALFRDGISICLSHGRGRVPSTWGLAPTKANNASQLKEMNG